MKKFIITKDGELILGDVIYHRDLLPENQYSCYGGGAWEIDEDNKVLYLNGESQDFGSPRFEYLKHISPMLNGYKILYKGKEIVNNDDPLSSITYIGYTDKINKEICDRVMSGKTNFSNIEKGLVHNFKFNDGYECKAKSKKEAEKNTENTKEKPKKNKPISKWERLQDGETFVTSEKGNSMTPIILSGQKHILEPITLDKVEVGDIVYCKVHGYFYTHLVKSIDPKKGLLIGNNHGGINGWTKSVYGKVIKILGKDDSR